MARWKIWLKQEADETVVEAVGSDEEEEIESYDLKTAQVRLDALKKSIAEASQENDSAEPANEDALAAKNVVPPDGLHPLLLHIFLLFIL